MTTLTETIHPGEFVLSEANGYRSREEGTIDNGADLLPGTVLGQKTADTIGAAAAATGNTGDGTVGSLTGSINIEAGDYTLVCVEAATNAGEFEIHTPSGVQLPNNATVGVAYTSDHLNFTIADGSSDFVAGDTFTITVSGSDKYVQLDEDAVDGSGTFGGILFGHARAASAEVQGTIMKRDCEVRASDLTWPESITTAEKNVVIAQAKAAGVILRS